MISSKIGQKSSWKIDRLENKDEYVENLILQLEGNVAGFKMFETFINCDSEMRSNLGGTDDESNVEWYENHIRRQLMKLDTTALAFLSNAITLIENGQEGTIRFQG
ncbi:MAG: hypothetical protein Unbinned2716contig1004_23 [Prokaryotic dsDNA virus sp.]|nr:MAG: hypothetical protein Unbinned2716contig1004_23 [Prokaryotic dsDNA virus sp.]|tara:strand:- start:12273 stop:12590 length:318 start_codon:yes stop_codon:yes gene_type:complete